MIERLYAFLEAVANTDDIEHTRNLLARFWLSFTEEQR
jgi:hypothetical protein